MSFILQVCIIINFITFIPCIFKKLQFPVCSLSCATFLRLNLRTTARHGGRVLVSISCAGAARRARGRREADGNQECWTRSARSGPSQSPALHTAPSSYSLTSPLPRAECSVFWRYIINTPRLFRLIFANLCQIPFFLFFLWMDELGWQLSDMNWTVLGYLALRQLGMTCLTN